MCARPRLMLRVNDTVLQDASSQRLQHGKRERHVAEKCMSAYHTYSRTVARLSRLTLSRLNLQSLPTTAEVVNQSKALCREYIYSRLKKQGLLSLKLEMSGAVSRPSDISTEIQLLGAELERMYPLLYQNISRQLNITLTSEAVVETTFTAIAESMFKTGVVTWGRVVALFAVAGALAVDCVQQGHAAFVNVVVEAFGSVTARYLAFWISRQGGWCDVARAFRSAGDAVTLWALTGLGAVVGFIATLAAVAF